MSRAVLLLVLLQIERGTTRRIWRELPGVSIHAVATALRKARREGLVEREGDRQTTVGSPFVWTLTASGYQRACEIDEIAASEARGALAMLGG